MLNERLAYKIVDWCRRGCPYQVISLGDSVLQSQSADALPIESRSLTCPAGSRVISGGGCGISGAA